MNRSSGAGRFQPVLDQPSILRPAAATAWFRATRLTEQRLWRAALAALCVVLLLPLLVVDLPPLEDYPNHLARAFVLASPDDPVLARMYAPHWSVIPNLAIDLILPPLIRLFPVLVAGRLVIAACILLTVAGVIAYNAALGGRWWSIGVGLAAYHTGLLYGFLNFDLSLGLAFLLAAAWLRWREDRPTLAIGIACAGAPLLFACHLMGLLVYGILIGSAELAQLRDFRPRPAVMRAAVLSLVFAVPAALYLMSALPGLGGDAIWVSVTDKLLQLGTTFDNYDWPLDSLTFAAAFGIPCACGVLGLGRFPRPAAIAICLLLAIYAAAPFGWKGTFLLDTRFSITLGLMMFAGFVPRSGWPVPLRLAAGGTLASLFAARLAILATVWAGHNTVLADVRAALAPVRPGQAVYVADASIAEAPDYWAANPYSLELSNGFPVSGHLGALVLLEHRAYWPFEFDVPSQQPIRTQEPYAGLAAKVGSMPDRRTTAAADLCGFDWVLLTDAEAVPRLPADRFRLVTDAGFAALYEIERCRP